MMISVGDVVVRRSYHYDLYFRVVGIKAETVFLQGLFHRLSANAPIDDVIPISKEKAEVLLRENNYHTIDEQEPVADLERRLT